MYGHSNYSRLAVQFVGNSVALGTNSRRQSNVLRGLDSESVSSLQGSLKRVEESPESSQRKQNRTPLYLSGGDHSHYAAENTDPLLTSSLLKQLNETVSGSGSATLAGTSATSSQHQLQLLDGMQQKKPFAMVRPRRILCAPNNEYRSFLSTLDLNVDMTDRLSKSLDLLPNQLRYRFDARRAVTGAAAVVPLSAVTASRVREPSSCSLDAGVALISHDPMPFIIDSGDNGVPKSRSRSRLMLCDGHDDAIDTMQLSKPSNNRKLIRTPNNCSNAPADFGEDAHSPLLCRQNSFPPDEKLQQKRWRSLESVNPRDADAVMAHVTSANASTATAPKKLSRNSLRSWLTNLFQGNGFSDASLRKVGAVQNRVKGFGNFSELPPAPEHESIV